ncbi:MAG: NAD(P)/FAD-dependent oxidoreductase [Ruminococcaceae bacterium]|nr:NAD(P)/FAD-dependent oxidoreductase [Oscillospiraceae bacterium]
MPDVAVIGGGAAGMMAALAAAEEGKDVLIIEKNKMLGRKVRITGKGRCNVTNSAPADEMLRFVPKNSRFLISSFKRFDNTDLISLLEGAGLKLKTERGGRVFPESDKAADVVNTFMRLLAKERVRVLICDSVTELLTEDGKIKGLKTAKGRTVLSEKVILCTGGKSYPLTGSDGSGYELAKSVGHTVVSPKAALVPLETKESWVAELQGLSLKNVAVALKENGKKIYDDFGEMMFTHFGITGPVVLSSSCHVSDTEKNSYTFEIDLKPALDEKQLEDRILRDFAENANKNFENALGKLYPQKLIPVMVKLSGIDPYKKVNSITREERRSLLKLTKCLALGISRPRPIDEAIVTDGGINTKEINPSTMESRLVGGLFFAGEVIDVAAYTGGYNLQIAFSTGYTAGKSASKEKENKNG